MAQESCSASVCSVLSVHSVFILFVNLASSGTLKLTNFLVNILIKFYVFIEETLLRFISQPYRPPWPVTGIALLYLLSFPFLSIVNVPLW
jgi:hypothetical protein